MVKKCNFFTNSSVVEFDTLNDLQVFLDGLDPKKRQLDVTKLNELKVIKDRLIAAQSKFNIVRDSQSNNVVYYNEQIKSKTFYVDVCMLDFPDFVLKPYNLLGYGSNLVIMGGNLIFKICARSGDVYIKSTINDFEPFNFKIKSDKLTKPIIANTNSSEFICNSTYKVVSDLIFYMYLYADLHNIKFNAIINKYLF